MEFFFIFFDFPLKKRRCPLTSTALSTGSGGHDNFDKPMTNDE
jgi:hypothetical protein